MESQRTVPVKILDIIDIALVSMATGNGDLVDHFLSILPKGTRIHSSDLEAYEKISDNGCWDDLLQLELVLIEEGLWS